MAKRIKIRGGELEKPRSKSAITIGKQSLEEFIADEESKEIGDTLTPDNLAPYHKSRSRYATNKGQSGHTRIYTRREINAMTWEKLLEDQKTIEGVIASILLSGKEVSGTEIQNTCVRHLNISKKRYSTRSTYLYNKTDFGKFIESRRDAKGRCFKFVPAALDCKPGELMHFVYKGNAKARATVLEHHKGLSAYLVEAKSKEKRERTKEELAEVKKKMEEMRIKKALKKEAKEENAKSLSAAINDVVSQTLGVNVSVGGRIEIVFKWE